MPFAIYGHSTGALIAFELTRELQGLVGPQLRGLFVAAQEAPHGPKPPPVSELPTEELLAFLRNLGGTPAEVLADPDIVDITLAAVRADFWLSESYEYRPGTVTQCPLHAFAGIGGAAACTAVLGHSTPAADIVAAPAITSARSLLMFSPPPPVRGGIPSRAHPGVRRQGDASTALQSPGATPA